MEYVLHELPCLPVATLSGGLMENSMGEQTGTSHFWAAIAFKHMWLHLYLSKCDLCPDLVFGSGPIQSHSPLVFEWNLVFWIECVSWSDVSFVWTTAWGEYVGVHSNQVCPHIWRFAGVVLVNQKVGWTSFEPALYVIPQGALPPLSKLICMHVCYWVSTSCDLHASTELDERWWTLTTYCSINEWMPTAGVQERRCQCIMWVIIPRASVLFFILVRYSDADNILIAGTRGDSDSVSNQYFMIFMDFFH